MLWKLEDARNQLSEVISKALAEGPQRIACAGGDKDEDTVVLLSKADYEKMTEDRMPFGQYLCSAPGMYDLDLERKNAP